MLRAVCPCLAPRVRECSKTHRTTPSSDAGGDSVVDWFGEVPVSINTENPRRHRQLALNDFSTGPDDGLTSRQSGELFAERIKAEVRCSRSRR